MKNAELKILRSGVKVMDYFHYRDYLRDLYHEAKHRDAHYNYVQFAEDLCFPGENVIRLTIAGNRNLSIKGANRITEAIGLTGPERRYLLALVKYNNARLQVDRDKFLRDLLAIKSLFLSSNAERRKLEYLSEWYFPVIREMCMMPDFEPNATWISTRLYAKLLPKQIKECLKKLESLGLIVFDQTRQRFVRSSEQILPERTVNEIAMVRFHQTMLEIAKESISRVEEDRIDVNAITVCISEETAMIMREKLHQFCKEMLDMERLSGPAPGQIYQINVQLFPFTRVERKKEERA